MIVFSLLMASFWGVLPAIVGATGEPSTDMAVAVYSLIGSLWFIFALYIWHDKARNDA